jgi:hypothetical protein
MTLAASVIFSDVDVTLAANIKHGMGQGTLKGGSITVLLTSCFIGLESAVDN